MSSSTTRGSRARATSIARRIPAGALRAMREARPADLAAGRSLRLGLRRGPPRARRERDGRRAARVRARPERRRVRSPGTRRCAPRRRSRARVAPTTRSRAPARSPRTSRRRRGEARHRRGARRRRTIARARCRCGARGSPRIRTEIAGSTRRCASRTRCSTASTVPPRTTRARPTTLATKVVVEAPKLADAAGAVAARARAVARAQAEGSVRDRGALRRRAREAGAGLARRAASRTRRSTSRPPCSASTKTGAAACRAAVTRANAAVKARGVKLNGWPDAVTACEKDEQLVTALYSGAKAHASKDPKLAIDWFGQVEQLFPSHRLADDARYRGALLVAQSTDEGHEARAEQMLRSLPDAYPAGDMRTEALFHVALGKMQHGDWEAAKPLLDRIVELAPDDRHWATAGRAEYFRARAAAATGDAEGARSRLVAHRRALPARVLHAARAGAPRRARIPALAARTLKDAAQRDADGAFPSTRASHPRVGGDRARRCGCSRSVTSTLRAARSRPPARSPTASTARWCGRSVRSTTRPGLPELGHSFSRGKLTDFLAHYPEGKWRVPWEVAYPRAFEAIVVKACAQNALPDAARVGDHARGVELRRRRAEPRERDRARCSSSRRPRSGWRPGRAFRRDDASLKRPEVSVELGTRLLSKLRVTHGHPALAIGAYNGGRRRGRALGDGAHDRRARSLRRARPVRRDAQLHQARALEPGRLRVPLRSDGAEGAPRAPAAPRALTSARRERTTRALRRSRRASRRAPRARGRTRGDAHVAALASRRGAPPGRRVRRIRASAGSCSRWRSRRPRPRGPRRSSTSSAARPRTRAAARDDRALAATRSSRRFARAAERRGPAWSRRSTTPSALLRARGATVEHLDRVGALEGLSRDARAHARDGDARARRAPRARRRARRATRRRARRRGDRERRGR